MDSILIVSNTSSTLSILSSMLQSGAFSSIATAQNGMEGRRNILENDYDLIIVDTPLPDEFGDDFVLHAAEKTDSGIILIVDEANLDDVAGDVEDAGIFVLPKPISPEFFYQSVKLLVASRKRLSYLEHENQKLQEKMEEMKFVNRAKLVLVQVLNMSEQQAHRYIEKQAMDMRRTKIEVAENILKMYDR